MSTRHRSVLVIAAALTLGACGDDDAGTNATDEPPAEAEVSVRAVAPAPFEDAPSTAPSGEVTLRLINDDEMGHSLVIDELGEGVDVVAGGSEGTTSVTLEPGTTYTYFCGVPGHRNLGMEGEFETEG